MLEKTIPFSVQRILSSSGLTTYGAGHKISKHGVLLMIGANYAHVRDNVDSLTPEDSEVLIKELRQLIKNLGYKCKIRNFVFPKTESVDYNDFVIKLLLLPDDIESGFRRRLLTIENKRNRWLKRANVPLGQRL